MAPTQGLHDGQLHRGETRRAPRRLAEERGSRARVVRLRRTRREGPRPHARHRDLSQGHFVIGQRGKGQGPRLRGRDLGLRRVRPFWHLPSDLYIALLLTFFVLFLPFQANYIS